MFQPRNPSPPDDQFDFFRNMCIQFLKPSRNLQPHRLTLEIFHKNLFVSPSASGDERESSQNKVSFANCDVSAPHRGNHERIPGSVAANLSYKKQMCHAVSEDISTKEGRRENRDKLSMKKTSHEDPDNNLFELMIHSDYLKSRLEAEQKLHADENAIKYGPEYMKPRSLKLIPDREIYQPKGGLRYRKRVKHDAASEVREHFESCSLEPERASKKKSERSVSNHSVAVKNELISDDGDRRHHKSSKRKRKKLAYSVESDSDALESSKPRRYKSSQSYKNISGSEDSDYYASDSRKTSRKKSHQKQLKNYRDYDYSDTELNSRSARRHEGSKNYKRERDLSDSDRSNSRGSSDQDRRYRYCHRNEYDTSDSDRSYSRRNSRAEKYQRVKNEPVNEFDSAESKYNPEFEASQDRREPVYFNGPESFYCKICQLSLNSESTYDSHINGKKHKKAVNSLKVPEIVKSSLSTLAQSKEGLRPLSSQNTKHVVVEGVAVLQSIVDNHLDNPLTGLEFVKEIHTGNEISYYCELCQSPCMTISIMPHLVGFKHQLHCMREFYNAFYRSNKDRSKKEIENFVIGKLYAHEHRYGRGKIVVVEAVPDPISPPHDEAGPSWRNSGSTMMRENEVEMLGVGKIGSYKDFDATKNDYYCKICDAHMNNRNMFSAHLVGKRHLKNEKKTAGERYALLKGTKAPPNTVSELEKMAALNHDDVIVGLSFIRETKTENGSLYNCYLCGSSCTAEIMDHLICMKHRIKYLETVNENRSIPNAIVSISELEVNTYTREALVLAECEKIEKDHGRGKVEVYLSKSVSF